MEEKTIEGIKARLEQLNIFELRQTARAVGVERPAADKKSAVVEKIIAIAKGTATPVPYKNSVGKQFADEELVKDILAFREKISG